MRRNLSASEAADWALYAKKHGPLTSGARIEHSAALICAVSSRIAGNKHSKIEDFLPKRIDEAEGEGKPLADLFKRKGLLNGK